MCAYVPPHRRQRNAPEDEFSCVSTVRCINLAKRSDKWKALQEEAGKVSDSFRRRIQRLDAVDGSDLDGCSIAQQDVTFEWDSTINAKYANNVTPGKKTLTNGEIGCALSHIALWRELAAMQGDTTTMFILEDDASFTRSGRKPRFAKAFSNAWKQLPEDWDMLYLGFSDRGERRYVETVHGETNEKYDRFYNPQVLLFRPQYGYHTHAYLLRKRAAARLLDNLPVAGPLDVWLADNQWFDLNVYCAVIANEGWRNDDGTYEGALLVRQDRGRGKTSDIEQSGML